MIDADNDNQHYAHLPEELLGKILESVPITVDKMNQLFDIQDEPIRKGIEELKSKKALQNKTC